MSPGMPLKKPEVVCAVEGLGLADVFYCDQLPRIYQKEAFQN